jgi:hypothetical protein
MALPSFFKRTRNKLGDWIPLSVVPLRRRHLTFWNTRVQPIITTLGPQVRADANWDWQILTAIGALTYPLLQEPKAFAVVYQHPTNKEPIVCALIHLACRFLYLPAANKRGKKPDSTFVWHCASAPTEALEPYFSNKAIPKQLAQLCLDIGVTLSIHYGHQGRLCLHADPASPKTKDHKDLLMEFYRNPPVGMTPLDPGIRIPKLRGWLAPNDGRYFYFDETSGQAFSQQFTAYR